MSEENTPAENEETTKATDVTDQQVPAHVPPHLREMFTKHDGAFADRPGFRNKANTKSKAQRKKRKKNRR